MGVQEIAEQMKPKVESAGFDRSVKFDTGADGVIVIDGATISTTDAPADCTIKLSLDDLEDADRRRSQPDDGLHDRQDQGRGRHVGRHGAQPADRLSASQRGVRGVRLSGSGGRARARRRSPCGRSASSTPRGAVERAWHQFQRQEAVRARRGRAWPARRSFPPRSRSAHSRARRRPAGSRRGRAARASAIACRISAEPMPAPFSDGSTASGPSSSAGRPPSPAATSHSRTVPTSAPDRVARDEGQALGRPPAAAQLLRRFALASSGPWRGRAAPRAPPTSRAVSATMRKRPAIVAAMAMSRCMFHGPSATRRCNELVARQIGGMSTAIRRGRTPPPSR